MEFESNTSYRTLMSLCGMSYQKTQRVYKNRSADKVAEFEEQLEKNSRFGPKPSENGDLIDKTVTTRLKTCQVSET